MPARHPGIRCGGSTPPPSAARSRRSTPASRRRAAGRFLFCDGDDTVPPGWLAAMARALAGHDFVATRMDTERSTTDWVRIYRSGRPARSRLRRLTHAPYCRLAGGAEMGFTPRGLRGRGRLRSRLHGAGGPRLLHPRASRGFRAQSGARDALQLPLPRRLRARSTARPSPTPATGRSCASAMRAGAAPRPAPWLGARAADRALRRRAAADGARRPGRRSPPLERARSTPCSAGAGRGCRGHRLPGGAAAPRPAWRSRRAAAWLIWPNGATEAVPPRAAGRAAAPAVLRLDRRRSGPARS